METKSQVSKTHPEYDAMATKWQRCRDTVAGNDAVKAAGTRYLPSLKDQTTEDYEAYKTRAKWFGAGWRTIQALTGMLFRRPPVVETSESVNALLEDVTMSGVSFLTFAQQIAMETLTVGRVGILVDYPSQSTEGMTAAEAAKLNLRPVMQRYEAENIINWKTAWICNKTVLTLVVLTEEAALEGNEFEHKTETRYRVLDLFNGAYRVRVFRIDDKGEDEQVGGDIFPVMSGKPLDFIPFFFLGVDDTTPQLDLPPLMDLVDLNLDHYRMSADHKHGLHFTGLPTGVITGYRPENEGDKLYVGAAHFLVLPDPKAKASFLEYTGQGLGAIVQELERTEQQMAILGARLLTAEKKATETAQTAQIHRAGESSVLSSIASTISRALTQALTLFSKWAGSDNECTVELNQEFLPPEMTPQELSTLLQGWQMGAPGLSDQGLFDILQKREVVASDATLEEEQARIAAKGPRMPDMGVE
jgi:hypothetical protein